MIWKGNIPGPTVDVVSRAQNKPTLVPNTTTTTTTKYIFNLFYNFILSFSCYETIPETT